jgi:hypothetical protein
LLLNLAVREVGAADVVLIAARAEMPHKAKDLLWLWLWSHSRIATRIPASGEGERGLGRASSNNFPELEEIGRLGDIDLLAFGGGEVAEVELMRGMRRALASLSQKTRGMLEEPICFGQAVWSEEDSRRSHTACSAPNGDFLKRECRSKETAPTARVLNYEKES